MNSEPTPAPDGQPLGPDEPKTEQETPTPGASYRVALDTYSGPLDLLLYLIRKNEVDIHDIPVALIAEQYQQYIEVMAAVNVNVAGEFLVMAATLMEIKSRMLLPLEEMEEEEEEDPRAELVRQLLEYKRYKDIARELGHRAAEQALKFPRPGLLAPAGPAEQEEEQDGSVDRFLEGVGLWELIEAFSEVLNQTSLGPPQTRILERERSIQDVRRELLQIVTTERNVAFPRIFADCTSRDAMIAMFIALLELVRLKQLRLLKPVGEGEVYIRLAQDVPAQEPTPVHEAAPDEQATAPPHAYGTVKRPEILKQTDVLADIEDEAESLGRARERIDAAIRAAENFLGKHHRQAAAGDENAAAEDAPADAPAEEPKPSESPDQEGGQPQDA